jgi:hypothetical protein
MQATLIVRTQEELETALAAIILGVSAAIEAAKASGTGSHVLPPEDLEISGMMVTTLAAASVTTTSTTPANTVTTTSTTPAATTTTTENIGAQTETSSQTPPNRTTAKAENGGDETQVDITHEDY